MNARTPAFQANELALAGALAALRASLGRLARQHADADAAPLPQPGSDEPLATLRLLRRRLDLSAFEARVLLLCAAAALDTRIGALCAAAQDDARRPWPTFALAFALFDDAHWEALSPHGPLRRWRLVDAVPDGATPLLQAPLRADDRIVDFLKGLNELDERLARTLVPLAAASADDLPPSQREGAERAVAALQAGGPVPPALVLTGAHSASKRLVVAAACERLGLAPHRVALGALPSNGADLDAWCRLWQRESRLLPLALLVEAHEGPPGQDGASGVLERTLDRLGTPVFIDVRAAADIDLAARDDLVLLPVDKPTSAEQATEWRRVLGPGAQADADAQRLAGQFRFDLPRLRALARQAAGGGSDALWAACREGGQPRLAQLAQRVDARAGWDDLVLPADALASLHRLVAQVALRRRVLGEWGFERRTGRGLGLAALFHGESGTGKTMAAEVVANALGVHLYRVDLSAVVSKYIGETEKNLQRIFDAAEDGGCVLFFDEADALFGKRSEVRDSHDRYANIETNYLLQRIEAFGGLAVLATNLKGALDVAFLRRLRFVVGFPFPGAREREAMWRRAFPPETPLGDFDPARLARLDCSGGAIHNIALDAAFEAARRGVAVDTAGVLEAARHELVKLGRPVHEADFRRPAAPGAPT